MKCRICGRGMVDCSGWLQRVNPTGLPGVWECRPGCDAPAMNPGDALIAAIESGLPNAERLGGGGSDGERCHSDDDGECSWEGCPQLRDGEPAATGRHCPLDNRHLEDSDG
jgi:hypothetical protein